MRIVGFTKVESKYPYTWPDGFVEKYDCVYYLARSPDGSDHEVRVGFCGRRVYGKDRVRVTAWIDGYPHAEFFSADDFDVSGDILSEIKIHKGRGESICRYPKEVVPERYAGFRTIGLPTRVSGKGVHNAWAVITNISDHREIVALAGLRRLERG